MHLMVCTEDLYQLFMCIFALLQRVWSGGFSEEGKFWHLNNVEKEPAGSVLLTGV